MMATFHDLDGVTIERTLTVTGITSLATVNLTGSTLTVGSSAAAGTDSDPKLLLQGGDGGSEVIRTTLGQDSSADVSYLTLGGGAAGATRKTPTFSLGFPGETGVGLDSVLRLEAASDAGVNRAASLTLLGQEKTLTLLAPATGTVSVSDGTGSLTVSGGAVTMPGTVSVDTDASTLRVGAAATAGVDADAYIRLRGGDGGSNLRETVIRQDSSAGRLQIEMLTGSADAALSPVVSVGRPSPPWTGMDATLQLAGSSDAGAARNASLTLEGEEARLTVAYPNGGILRASDGSLTQFLGGRVYSLAAQGTVVTGTASETTSASYIIPAGALREGTILRISGRARCTAASTASKCTPRLKLGGTVLASGALHLPTSGQTWHASGEITSRGAPGAAVNLVGHGVTTARWDAAAAPLIGWVLDPSAFATNGMLLVELTLQWEAADANAAAAESLTVEII